MTLKDDNGGGSQTSLLSSSATSLARSSSLSQSQSQLQCGPYDEQRQMLRKSGSASSLPQLADAEADTDADAYASSAMSLVTVPAVEWIAVQKRTFTNWVNSKFYEVAKLADPTTTQGDHAMIADLSEDLRDGRVLLRLVAILAALNEKYSVAPPTAERMCTLRIHFIANVGKALKYVEKISNMALSGIGSEDIVDGNLKLTLGLIWQLILRFQFTNLNQRNNNNNNNNSNTSSSTASLTSLNLVVPAPVVLTLVDIQRNVLSKVSRWLNTGHGNRDFKRLLPSGPPKTFGKQWADGRAFCCVVHAFVPEQLDLSAVNLSSSHEAHVFNLTMAFEAAAKYLDIISLLDPNDVASCPEEKSILTYLSCFVNVEAKKFVPDPHWNEIVEETPSTRLVSPDTEMQFAIENQATSSKLGDNKAQDNAGKKKHGKLENSGKKEVPENAPGAEEQHYLLQEAKQVPNEQQTQEQQVQQLEEKMQKMNQNDNNEHKNQSEKIGTQGQNVNTGLDDQEEQWDVIQKEELEEDKELFLKWQQQQQQQQPQIKNRESQSKFQEQKCDLVKEKNDAIKSERKENELQCQKPTLDHDSKPIVEENKSESMEFGESQREGQSIEQDKLGKIKDLQKRGFSQQYLQQQTLLRESSNSCQEESASACRGSAQGQTQSVEFEIAQQQQQKNVQMQTLNLDNDQSGKEIQIQKESVRSDPLQNESLSTVYNTQHRSDFTQNNGIHGQTSQKQPPLQQNKEYNDITQSQNAKGNINQNQGKMKISGLENNQRSKLSQTQEQQASLQEQEPIRQQHHAEVAQAEKPVDHGQVQNTEDKEFQEFGQLRQKDSLQKMLSEQAMNGHNNHSNEPKQVKNVKLTRGNAQGQESNTEYITDQQLDSDQNNDLRQQELKEEILVHKNEEAQKQIQPLAQEAKNSKDQSQRPEIKLKKTPNGEELQTQDEIQNTHSAQVHIDKISGTQKHLQNVDGDICNVSNLKQYSENDSDQNQLGDVQQEQNVNDGQVMINSQKEKQKGEQKNQLNQNRTEQENAEIAEGHQTKDIQYQKQNDRQTQILSAQLEKIHLQGLSQNIENEKSQLPGHAPSQKEVQQILHDKTVKQADEQTSQNDQAETAEEETLNNEAVNQNQDEEKNQMQIQRQYIDKRNEHLTKQLQTQEQQQKQGPIVVQGQKPPLQQSQGQILEHNQNQPHGMEHNIEFNKEQESQQAEQNDQLEHAKELLGKQKITQNNETEMYSEQNEAQIVEQKNIQQPGQVQSQELLRERLSDKDQSMLDDQRVVLEEQQKLLKSQDYLSKQKKSWNAEENDNDAQNQEEILDLEKGNLSKHGQAHKQLQAQDSYKNLTPSNNQHGKQIFEQENQLVAQQNLKQDQEATENKNQFNEPQPNQVLLHENRQVDFHLVNKENLVQHEQSRVLLQNENPQQEQSEIQKKQDLEVQRRQKLKQKQLQVQIMKENLEKEQLSKLKELKQQQQENDEKLQQEEKQRQLQDQIQKEEKLNQKLQRQQQEPGLDQKQSESRVVKLSAQLLQMATVQHPIFSLDAECSLLHANVTRSPINSTQLSENRVQHTLLKARYNELAAVRHLDKFGSPQEKQRVDYAFKTARTRLEKAGVILDSRETGSIVNRWCSWSILVVVVTAVVVHYALRRDPVIEISAAKEAAEQGLR